MDHAVVLKECIQKDLLLKEGKSISQFLQTHKEDFAHGFLNSALKTTKWKDSFEQNKNRINFFVELEFYAFIDYLAFYFSSAEECYLNLYIGEKLKEAFDPLLNYEDNCENKSKILA